MDNVYTSLQKLVTDLTDKISKKQDEITSMQNDSGYVYRKTRLDRLINNGYGIHAWVDSAGIPWNGEDAKAERLEAETYISNYNSQLTSKINALTELKNQLKDAQDSINNYQNNSPVVKSQLEANALELAGVLKNKKTVIISITIVIILIISTIFILKIKQNKKI